MRRDPDDFALRGEPDPAAVLVTHLLLGLLGMLLGAIGGVGREGLAALAADECATDVAFRGLGDGESCRHGARLDEFAVVEQALPSAFAPEAGFAVAAKA